MTIIVDAWNAYKDAAPFMWPTILVFWTVYCLTSFSFWFFWDRNNRKDLRIQAHKEIPKISDIYINVCTNLFIISPIQAAVMDQLTGAQQDWTVLSIPEYALYLFLTVVSVDVLFYWSHRLCHTTYLYPIVHKRHHELHSPIAFSAVYAHWFEHIFVNVNSTFLFQYCIQNSWLTLTFGAIAAFKTCQGHSGYDFSFIGESWNYHDLHHENPKFNYGSGALMIFDRLFGTLKSREEIDSLMRISEKARKVLKTAKAA